MKRFGTILIALATVSAVAAQPAKQTTAKTGPHPWTPFALAFYDDMQTSRPDADVKVGRLGLLYGRNHDVSIFDGVLGCAEAEGDGTGLQLSCVNVVDGSEAGIQLGFFANWAGESHHGIQLAGLFNFGGFNEGNNHSAGIQLAGGFNRSRDFSGLQMAFLVNSSRKLRGGQIAAINMPAKNSIRGFQIGLINSGAEDFHGLQMGAVCTGCKHMSGLQLGLITSANELHGAQMGIVNLADDASGLQLGIYNRAKTLRKGIQIGLINHRMDSDIPFLPLVRATF